MAYRPITHAALPPQVGRLLWKLERHFLEPAHGLLRLPLPDENVVGEFNFTIANLLLSVIAGISTTLYESEGGNGERFQGALLRYYPFHLEPADAPARELIADTLWSVFRNALAHDLGFDVRKHAKTPETKVMRNTTRTLSRDQCGLTEEQIAALEDSAKRPQDTATVQIRPDATVLSIEALYWGVRCMVEAILADAKRVQDAEVYLASL